jgi:ATP-dependent DNA ligase
VFILQIREGTGRLAGTMGAVEVGVRTGESGYQSLGWVGMGFTDEDRRAIYDAEGLGWRRLVLEIQYQAVMSNGGLQHARFKRFRDDKTTDQCTWEQFAAAM